MAWWQIVLLTIYAGYYQIDGLNIMSSLSKPVAAGLITGLVMGNMKIGLIIGGAMQLTVLGIGNFGGASMIDATTGTIIATAFSVSVKGMTAPMAISSIAVPVAALMVEMDVLGRFANTYFAHRINRLIDKFDYKGIERNFLYGAIPWFLSRAVPVCLALSFGSKVVTPIANSLNGNLHWLGNGLTVAGAALPAVGFAVLLRQLPVRKHIAYLILGFTFTTLFSVLFTNVKLIGTGLMTVSKGFTGTFNNLPMLTIALIGLGFAIIHYERNKAMDSGNTKPQASKVVNNNVEGEITDDEL